jgi:hypothetical protein
VDEQTTTHVYVAIVIHMTTNTRKIPGRLAAVLAVLTLLLVAGQATSASALGSGKFAWRGDDGTTYYYYGTGGTSGTLAYATTNAPGSACLRYVKRVKTRIALPNGSFATHSSLLGQCYSSVDIAHGPYSVFQIRSTHTLQKWNGTEYNYVL